jgi:hypothetical protein
MAQTSYPFDEQSVTEDQWSAMMSTAQESRVVTGLAVFGDSSGRQVKAPLGTAWVRGHFYQSTAEEVLAVGANASGNPRIDTVVLTLDPTANSIVLAIVAGTAAAAPVPPTLTQTDTGVYQYPLANVTVANGAATIAATDVTPRARIATATVGRNMPGSNLLQNGSFKVAQRGTSFTASSTPANSDDTYMFDRWYLLSDGNNIVDVATSGDFPTGFTRSLAHIVVTANKKFGTAQIIEASNIKHALGGQVTFSFYAKADASIGNVKAAVLAWNSTADTVTSDLVSAWGASGTTPTWAANWTAENVPTNLNVTTSWARYTVTATLDTASTTNVAVVVWCDDAATTANDVLRVVGLQLETGSAATGFEHKDLATETAECQRYFWQAVSGSGPLVGMGFYNSSANPSTNLYVVVNYPVTMRTVPVPTSSNGTNHWYALVLSTSDEFNTFSAYYNTSTTSLVLEANAGTGVSVAGAYGYPCIVSGNAAASSLAISADL